jgi:hypothetical protein
LTGGDAILGQTQREGVMLAVDEINAGGGINGRKVEVRPLAFPQKQHRSRFSVTAYILLWHTRGFVTKVEGLAAYAGARIA